MGCHLTLESVARNSTDPHVVFVPLDAETPAVDLQVAWRRHDQGPALLAVIHEVLRLDIKTLA